MTRFIYLLILLYLVWPIEWHVSDGQLSLIFSYPVSQGTERANTSFSRSLSSLVKVGGVAVGEQNQPDLLFQRDRYIPASILKIVVALVALDRLGPDYHFSTRFFIDDAHNLIIKGSGDPMISTDTWYKIAGYFKKYGYLKKPFNHLIIDESNFVSNLSYPGQRRGTRYYEAAAGTLVTNFNTASIVVKKNQLIVSQNGKTPITDFIRKKARYLRRGQQYLNIAQTHREGSQYTGELIKAIFKRRGGRFQKKIVFQKKSPGAKLLYHYRSKQNLATVIKRMFKNSNNFIANQLFLVLALESYGAPANFKNAVKYVTRSLTKKLHLREDNLYLVEGSGLSRRNKIDLKIMLAVINHFKPYRNLLPKLKRSKYPTLKRVGTKWNILAKSGTLSGVFNLVGFVETKNHDWKPFVIMLNQAENNRAQVLKLIGKHYF
jgi:D-alanyl-D-alanine carboxypeptidase/D-alanyl-D-alanine-endopeptidase (penicillin-binding protein 4)